MADDSSKSVAMVAIVILVLVTMVGGYMVFGVPGRDKNDIHIDLPGDGRKNN
jgi:hypothetical protein